MNKIHQDAQRISLNVAELPDIIGGSCHKYHFCRDKHVFFATKHVFFCFFLFFVATKVCLPQQKCRDKITFVPTKYFCRDKHVFVATKMIIVAAPTSYNQKRRHSRAATPVLG